MIIFQGLSHAYRKRNPRVKWRVEECGLAPRDWVPSPTLQFIHWFSRPGLSLGVIVPFKLKGWVSLFLCWVFSSCPSRSSLQPSPPCPVLWNLTSRDYMNGLPCFLAPYCILYPIRKISRIGGWGVVEEWDQNIDSLGSCLYLGSWQAALSQGTLPQGSSSLSSLTPLVLRL